MLFSTISPMLLTKTDHAFDEDGWVWEPKWDGWRLLLHKDGDDIRIFTRHGNIVTNKFPELVAAGKAIEAKTAILDGEGICLRTGGPSFEDMEQRGRLEKELRIQTAMQTSPVTFMAFDALYKDGVSYIQEPLLKRKEVLQTMVPSQGQIATTMFVERAGTSLSRETLNRQWEGLVGKRADSRYVPGSRTDKWLKVKHFSKLNTVILGYRRRPRFALIVGVHLPNHPYHPVAAVEFGYRHEERQAFLAVAPQIHTIKNNGVQWVEPKLCCEVQYLNWTSGEKLRITKFDRFLPGVHPDDCVATHHSARVL